MATTIRQELDEEFLSAIRKGQELTLEALKHLVEAVHYVIPTMPVVRVPLASRQRTKSWPTGTNSPSTCWLTSGSSPTR
jgi:hypothetical protein